MSKEKEDFREFVSPRVAGTVEAAGVLYGKGHRIHDKMEELEAAQEKMKQNKAVRTWGLRFETDSMQVITLSSKDELSAEIWEATLQYLTLLEAIHYSERKQAIIDFNNSLKKADDGSSTEK